MKYILKNISVLVLLSVISVFAQAPELGTAQIKLGRIWSGVAANGDQATFNFSSGFFPNDFDLMQYRGQGSDNYTGSGFKLGATDWTAPNDTFYTAAVFGPKNDFYSNGNVTVPITSYLRYKYPQQVVNGSSIPSQNFAVYDPSKLVNGTYDQMVDVTYKNVMGVDVKRKILGWSQNYNNNYLIIEVELTNVGVDGKAPDTLRNFFFSMQQSTANNYYSNGNQPAPAANETPKYAYVWHHYYGARPGDSMRVFYFYNADDPATSGDNMGSPVVSQGGRLINTNYTFYSIIHASQDPYLDPVNDVNDPLQPKVTYVGTETKIPSPGNDEDPYGSKNYWAMRGAYSDRNLMPGAFPETHHEYNTDELGIADFSNYDAGTLNSINAKNFSSFGPYQFPPDHKIKIVYAVGFTGIGIKLSDEVGRKWLNGTLENPPNMPDANTGWLPSNFVFPNGATEMDKRKDRWISMGKDSVMLAAWRAKWNYEHNYSIPMSPPPPETFSVTGTGDLGVVIKWTAAEAESKANFAGYTISRKVSNSDTLYYKEIYSSGPDDKAAEHTFRDTTSLPGAQTYYYIQSKAKIDDNDLNADPTTRGKMMYSSRLWIPNLVYINPPTRSYEEMGRIRVVPNPYNINDPVVLAQGWTDQRGIKFVNLPAVVTIKIYTENGDLVTTIDHNHPVDRAGSETWDMLTSSRQVISSGVYIAVFQKPGGETSFQKFVVVR